MQPLQPGQQLPVPADQYLSNQMLSQIPPMPPTQGGHMLSEQELFSLHSALISVLQNKAPNNPLRAFMFNLYSQGQYNNQGYAHLLSRAAGYASMLRDVQRHGDYINLSAEQSALTELVILVGQYPGLGNYIDQQTYNTLQQIEQERQQIQQQMQQYANWLQNQNTPPAPGMGGHMPPAGGGGVPPAGGGGMGPGVQPPHRVSQGFSTHGMGGTPPPRNMGHTAPTVPPQASNNAPPMPGATPPGGGNTTPGVPVQPRAGSQNQNGSGSIHQNVNRIAGGHPGGAGPQPTSDRPAVGMMQPDGDILPKDPQNNPQRERDSAMSDNGWSSADERQLSQELHRQVHHEERGSEREPEWYRMPLVRRTDQRLISQRGEDGVLYYRLEDAEMDYTDHEDDPRLIDYYRRHKAGPKIERRVDWAEVTQPQIISQDSEDEEEGETPDIGEEEPVILSSTPIAYSYEHAISQILATFESETGTKVGSRVLESDFELCTPVHLDEKSIEALRQLLETKNIDDFVWKFHEIGRFERIPSYVWYMLHDRLTRIFADQLIMGTGDGEIAPDSFIDDYQEALGYVSGFYQDDSPSFKEFWSRMHRAMLQSLGLRVYSEGNAMFFEPHTLTYLPWSASQIGVVVSSELSYLNDSVDEDLQLAIESIVKRTRRDDGSSSSRRVLVTADHVWLEIISNEQGLAPHIYLRRID